MMYFYGGGYAIPKISPHVETLHATSLRRKRSKHTSAVQRGEVGIPKSIQLYLRMWLYGMYANENKAYSLKLIAYGLFFVSLLFSLEAQSQPRKDIGAVEGRGEVKPLQIGDTIPEELWNMPLQVVNHPEDRETITLNDYRDKKLIILDFWATWCAPCIGSLNKLDSIQPTFAQDLQIIPITQQAKDIVAPFLKKQQWRHLSTYGPSSASRYFPHATIPHQVWIKGKRILALTGSEYTETKFIKDVLNGGNPFMFMKVEDVSFDPKVPLFARMADDTSQWQSRIGTFSILTVHQPDLPFACEWWDGKSWMITNVTIPALYARAFADSIPQTSYGRRLVMEVADSLKEHVVYPQHAKKYDRKIWLATNTYCYHAGIAVPVNQGIYRKRLKSELNDFFRYRYGLEGKIEKRMVDMLELSIGDMDVFHANSRERSKDDIYYPASVQGDSVRFRNASAQSLISRIIYISRRSDIPINNSIDSERIFTVDVPKGKDPLSDLEGWNVGLAKVGLRLVRKIDQLDMLVIRSLNNE